MTPVLAAVAKSIRNAAELEISSLVTNKSKLLFAGSLGIIKSAAGNKKRPRTTFWSSEENSH